MVPKPIPNGIIDMDDALIIMRKAIGLVSMNLEAIQEGLKQYAKTHEEQQGLIAHFKTVITHHKDQLLLSMVDLDDRIITQADAIPKKLTRQPSPAMKKGILVATIGDLTGLLSGPYEDIYYYINDHLGTPQMLTDQHATVVWQADYDPFGKASVNDDPDGDGTTVTNNVRFPGQYFDSETGLHYNYHRYYDPGIGRYLTPDPIGFEGGINLYTYVENNPVRFIDLAGTNRATAGAIGRSPRALGQNFNLMHGFRGCTRKLDQIYKNLANQIKCGKTKIALVCMQSNNCSTLYGTLGAGAYHQGYPPSSGRNYSCKQVPIKGSKGCCIPR